MQVKVILPISKLSGIRDQNDVKVLIIITSKMTLDGGSIALKKTRLRQRKLFVMLTVTHHNARNLPLSYEPRLEAEGLAFFLG